MTTLSDFRINQLANGTYTISRRDLIPTSVAGTPVELEASTTGLTSYKWEVTQTPGSTVALTGSTSQACTIPAELEGGYLARLTVNEGLANESISELYFGIGLEIHGIRYAVPALTETIQDNSIGHPEYGWLEKLLEVLRALATNVVEETTWEGDTTTNSPTEIFVGGVPSARESVPANMATAYEICVTSLDDTQVHSKTWKIECTAVRDYADNTSLIDVPIITILSQTDTSGGGTGTDLWDVAVTVDDSDDTLVLTVTGQHMTNIGWAAKSHTVSALKMNSI